MIWNLPLFTITSRNGWEVSESLRQASGTQAQVLALLNLTELQRYKPRLKERRLWLFVPFMYITPQQGPHYSQPSGKYHSQG